MRIRILAFLLMLTIVPSAMEMVEAVVHWVEHGDSAHADGHDAAALGTDEHGCSGTFHLCGRHAPGVMTPSFVVNLSVDSCADHGSCFEPAVRAGLGATAPPIRPPIA